MSRGASGDSAVSNGSGGSGGGGGGGDGGAGTTHPSWQVPREHHAQGSNIPFGESLTLINII